MNVVLSLAIGACVHGVIGATIFFAPEEPYKVQILSATIIKGLLVALLIGFSLAKNPSSGIWHGLGYGLLYGLAFGAVIFLAKGADFKSTPHVISGSAIQGALTGLLIAWLAVSNTSSGVGGPTPN